MKEINITLEKCGATLKQRTRVLRGEGEELESFRIMKYMAENFTTD